jgi:hypothetical protein
MFDHHEWMTNFVPITPRSWQEAIVDDSRHSVPGIGDVHILKDVDVVWKKVMLKGVI